MIQLKQQQQSQIITQISQTQTQTSIQTQRLVRTALINKICNYRPLLLLLCLFLMIFCVFLITWTFLNNQIVILRSEQYWQESHQQSQHSQAKIDAKTQKNNKVSEIKSRDTDYNIYDSQSKLKQKHQQQQNPNIQIPTSQQLKQYYENIESKVLIIKICTNTQYSQTYIINALNYDKYTYKDKEGQINNQVKHISSVVSKLMKFSQILIILDYRINRTSQLINQLKLHQNGTYQISQHIQKIDSSYNFLRKHATPTSSQITTTTRQSNTLIYISLQTILIYKITDIQQISHFSTSKTTTKQQLLIFQLNSTINQNLYKYRQIDWHSINLTQINLFQIMIDLVFVFDQWYLDVITPTNFAYQNVYTLEEIVIMPVLTLGQLTNNIVVQSINVQRIKHKQNTIYKSEQLLKIIELHNFQLTSEPNIQISSIQLCFITLLSNQTISNQSSIKQLNNLLQNYLDHKQFTLPIRLIIPVPYQFPNYENENNYRQLLNLIDKLIKKPNLSVKILIREIHKISAGLIIFQSAHTYCNKNSIIVSHRDNVMPDIANIQQIVQKQLALNNICSNKNQTKHVIIGNYQDIHGNIIKLDKISNINGLKRWQYDHYYHTHLLHVQIFCSKLIRTMQYYAFKWQETEFYQTEYSYAIPILQLAHNNILQSEKVLFQVKYQRKLSQKQIKQIQGLKLRRPYQSINLKQIKQLKYNGLNNFALRRNPINLIPPIIHQIWLSNRSQISPVKQSLMKTLINSNPTFEYNLWTLQNITIQNFPLTFNSIQKYQAFSIQDNKNYRAIVADLMRIQILYRYGGIYCDMKVQGRKSLMPFLKYQQFYYFVGNQSLVNGIIGSMPGNRQFKYILENYFQPEHLTRPVSHIYDQTGGPVLAKAYTEKQKFTQVLNFNQFVGEGERPCIYNNQKKQSQSDQQVFKGTTAKGQKYRIFIPCKQNNDKYLQLYNVLGRTYLPNAEYYW